MRVLIYCIDKRKLSNKGFSDELIYVDEIECCWVKKDLLYFWLELELNNYIILYEKGDILLDEMNNLILLVYDIS